MVDWDWPFNSFFFYLDISKSWENKISVISPPPPPPQFLPTPVSFCQSKLNSINCNEICCKEGSWGLEYKKTLLSSIISSKSYEWPLCSGMEQSLYSLLLEWPMEGSRNSFSFKLTCCGLFALRGGYSSAECLLTLHSLSVSLWWGYNS